MKKTIFTFFALFSFLGFQAFSQEYKADDILGFWLNEDKDAHIQIYKVNGKYFGKLIWLKNPIDEETGKPKLDKENPDEKLRSRPIKSLVILTDFEFDGDDEWEDGDIYDPKSGNDYSCYMKFVDDHKNKLKIRGYVGITLFGRTTYWTRVKE